MIFAKGISLFLLISQISFQDRINETEDTDNINSESFFNKTVYGQTNFAIKNLRHYAVYTIEVQACREPVENDTLSNCCSTKSIKTARTLPLEAADDIPEKSFVHKLLTGNNSRSTVKLVWEEPPDPNGLIVTYQIEYRNVNIQNVSNFLSSRSWFVDLNIFFL